MEKDIDVTNLVDISSDAIDSELLPLLRCICGARFNYWEFCISIYRDDTYVCPFCKRKMYFTNDIHVYEVKD